MKEVEVQYTGKKPDLTLAMPWMSSPVTFLDANGRTAIMPTADASRLLRENPASFMLISGQIPMLEDVADIDEDGIVFDDSVMTEPVEPVPLKPARRRKGVNNDGDIATDK